jgi:glutathione S-transferase
MNTLAAADRPARPIRLHRFSLSGHAHRVELFLSLLDLPVELVEVDLARGEQKTQAFLAMNPFAQVPVIQDGELTLADSNAILTYLALRYDPSGHWLPRDPLGAALVQRWLSVAAGALASGPARARAAAVFGSPSDPRCAETAVALFGLMNAQLADAPFLTGRTPTIADVALYSYTAHAPEGGITLQPYGHVQRWLQRIEALPGFVGMERRPTLAATT